MKRLILESTTDFVKKYQSEFHQSTVEVVQKASLNNKVLVVGMKINPVCKQACKNLSNRNIDFEYLSYGSYFSQWKQRLAIKIWAGWPTFPMVFVDGELIGGNQQLEKLLEQGKFN